MKEQKALAFLVAQYQFICNGSNLDRYFWPQAQTSVLTMDERLMIMRQMLIMTITPEAEQPFPMSEYWCYHFPSLLYLLEISKLVYRLEDMQAILLVLSQKPIFDLVHPSTRVEILQGFRALLSIPENYALCLPLLVKTRLRLQNEENFVQAKKSIKQLSQLIGDLPRHIEWDSWGKQVMISLEEMAPALRERCLALIAHCARAKGDTPNPAWLEKMHFLVQEIGRERFSLLWMEWLGFFLQKSANRLDEDNGGVLKGWIWCHAALDDEFVVAMLGNVAIYGFDKLPGQGPRAAKIASACVSALRCLKSLQGAAQLVRIQLHVKQASFLKMIDVALQEVAERNKMSREDLEELTLSNYELVDGRRKIAFTGGEAEIHLVGARVKIQWYDSQEKARKSEPIEVRRNQKHALNELKQLVANIQKMLQSQKMRLERLLLSDRSWMLADWRDRYLEHGLLGCLVKRLIWNFGKGEQWKSGIWFDGQIVGVDGEPIEILADYQVTLWHPLNCEAEEVASWRAWLTRQRLVQPFKQAYREIYLLTEAEINTQTYSNRFAGHILRQQQFHALTIARGWKSQLHLMVDDIFLPPRLELPHWGLQVEFWIDGIGDNYDSDATPAGSYIHIATDQVRFYRLESEKESAQASVRDAPLPLAEIPPLVLSEVMRDLDLFVGVTSVGNDPIWQDGGPEGRHQDYWYSYSFGELSATAQTRCAILEALIPSLDIADRCSIHDRFLRVQGDIRTYRIHLGSGNILMEPNDEYLCIVMKRNPDTSLDTLYLPFDEDTIFSLILSKALLLANDKKITDPTILNQLKRKL